MCWSQFVSNDNKLNKGYIHVTSYALNGFTWSIIYIYQTALERW